MAKGKVEPRIFKGTRDLLPETMRLRNRVIGTLRAVFEAYGFEPLETPAFEFYDILTGKSGEEADHLLFPLAYQDGRTLALRYDLTVPLSRVVAMYGKSMAFPFRRYQIQPVWRAEKPQKGRYREFLQCDVDIVGTPAMAADAEILLLASEAMERLGLEGFTAALNHRMIIDGLYERFDVDEKDRIFVSRTLDKIDKVGRDEVRRMLVEGEAGATLDACVADGLLDVLEKADLDAVEEQVRSTNAGARGVTEVREILEMVRVSDTAGRAVRYAPSLMRGLDYYTGPVFEMVVEKPRIGSLGGGGRYDGLVGLFSGEDVPATGFSFGVERLVDALQESRPPGLDARALRAAEILVTVFSPELRPNALAAAQAFRAADLRAELYLGASRKLKKQFDYANKKNIPVVAVIGPDEAAQGAVTLKWMDAGEQETLPLASAPARAKEKL